MYDEQSLTEEDLMLQKKKQEPIEPIQCDAAADAEAPLQETWGPWLDGLCETSAWSNGTWLFQHLSLTRSTRSWTAWPERKFTCAWHGGASQLIVTLKQS